MHRHLSGLPEATPRAGRRQLARIRKWQVLKYERSLETAASFQKHGNPASAMPISPGVFKKSLMCTQSSSDEYDQLLCPSWIGPSVCSDSSPRPKGFGSILQDHLQSAWWFPTHLDPNHHPQLLFRAASRDKTKPGNLKNGLKNNHTSNPQ